MNLTADLFDKADLICRIYKRNVKTLTLTAPVKAKLDSNPYKQIPDAKAYLEHSRKSAMELFYKNS